MPFESQYLTRLFCLDGKVALVTGGSRGIGYMIAEGLLQVGAKVYISARRKEDCAAAAEKLSAFGPCQAITADVVQAAAREKILRTLEEREGHLDVLINNAGTAWGDAYEKYPEEAFDKVFRTNVGAMFSLTRDLSPMLEKRACPSSPSSVVNIGSIDGLHIPTVHRTGTFAYTASKAAVHHLTRHLAQELGRKHITVNAIAPGFFPSKMTDSIFEQHGADLVANSLLGRVGQATDIAGTAIYLASAAGAYTHGVVLPVDGGTLINHQHARD
jgi:NAD(P)-dependent dehydrogenase (short-subunit alcohol dehydrogenase family)